jgi:hypothetical protein
MARTDDRQSPGDDGGSLRGLTGRGPSQVGVSGAMRARDVSRPHAAHLTAAEALDLDVASRRQQRRKGRDRPRSSREGRSQDPPRSSPADPPAAGSAAGSSPASTPPSPGSGGSSPVSS